MDIQALYAFRDWRAVPDAVLAREHAALTCLGPLGFLHFLPAYLSLTLRHLGDDLDNLPWGLWSLTFRATDETLTRLDAEQREAVVSVLEAVRDAGDNDYREDVDAALRAWLDPSDARARLPRFPADRTNLAPIPEECNASASWFEALGRRDRGTLLALMAPKAAFRCAQHPGELRGGRQGLRRLFADVDARIGPEMTLLEQRQVIAGEVSLLAEGAAGQGLAVTHRFDVGGLIMCVESDFFD